MLLAGQDLLRDDPFGFFALMTAVALALLVSISVHEFSHAAAANRLGDSTARRLGRLTLNPKAHLDPVGTLMLLVVGFGWGRPVPVNASALRNGRRGMAAVSLAGPASNLVLAFAVAMLFQVGLLDFGLIDRGALGRFEPGAWAAYVGWYGVLLNLILAAFNLIPLAPLDGSGILRGIVPRAWLPALRRVEVYGPLILIGVIGLQVLGGVSVLGFVFGPVIDFADVLVGA